MFIDRVKLKVKAGNGGNGLVAFRREKYVPLGGPAGGDGGKGGSIIFEVDTNKSTLLDLRFNRLIKAQPGGNGRGNKMHGPDAEDIIIKVPQGTMVKDLETGGLVADLVKPDQRAVIAQGGKGGRGNWHFATGRNNAPDYAELGDEGESKEVTVELKLLADVGLVGFPSVGKSTLLSVVSKAKPEIAEYHFTTITPNLGMVQVSDGRSFVMADLPGLIEGASEGKGLGHQFLRHIERCRVLVHVIDMGGHDGRDPIEDYRIINKELEQYHLRLTERPQVVIANKMDLDAAEENLKRFKEAYPNIEIFPTVTIIHEGLDQVLYRIADLLAVTPDFPLTGEEEKQEGVLFKFKPKAPDFTVHNLGNGQWRIEGKRVERLFASIDFEKEEEVYRFASTLKKIGVDEALHDAGATEGDLVFINDFQFEYLD
ncbi:GTPase ObgE [Anaerorhabdus furcosa]|uniref:GTPase Obg n=1 Tax=Anaerorhabdus furcosa TaxID=118967 RepID=A0A1T4Q626_9FIRM|nr:GTPase ObgE [Anaerorhabdus furcosa]SJZ99146.1 GTP-binding protein [Anaerorhabdus furcosa]